MRWYEEIISELDGDRIYSHKELIAQLKLKKPNLSDNSCQWSVNALTRSGKLSRKGYDAYALSSGDDPAVYSPEYSDTANRLIEAVDARFPHVRFTVFETVLMNDFLNHLIAQNTIFIQVEKESGIFVFRFLQDEGFPNVLFKPDKDDFALYWSKDVVVVTDMVSEAPLRNDRPHVIALEKMLVDMRADKLISTTYGKEEYPNVIEQAKSRYLLDKTRMLRYARRRNKLEEIKGCLKR